MRALLWPLFARSAWGQPAYVLVRTKDEGAAVASVLSVDVVSASPCVGGTTDEGAACVTVFSVGEGSGIHCGGGHDR